MKIRSDVGQLTIGQFAYECSIYMKLNANRSVKNIQSGISETVKDGMNLQRLTVIDYRRTNALVPVLL